MDSVAYELAGVDPSAVHTHRAAERLGVGVTELAEIENLGTPLAEIDLLFVENVGNLICPAEFDLGEHKRVMILSLPEGDDKPEKYPLMFAGADVVLMNKIDLQPYLDFDVAAFKKVVTGLNPAVKILPVSGRTGDGVEVWLAWLQGELAVKRQERHDAITRVS